jgi:hypothetical protein
MVMNEIKSALTDAQRNARDLDKLKDAEKLITEALDNLVARGGGLVANGFDKHDVRDVINSVASVMPSLSNSIALLGKLEGK